EVVAQRAAANDCQRARQRLRERLCAGAIVLQQVVRHALRRAGTDAGQRPEGFDEPFEPLRRGHRHAGGRLALQNGSLNPGGRPRPAVIPPIFSLIVLSTRLAASLNAAATRSSSISRSSPTSDGSIETRFTSYLQVICTFTIPAPD